MPRRRKFSFRITLADLGLAGDPSVLAAPPAAKAELRRWVAVYGLKWKDAELAAGLDRFGAPLLPVAESTRRHRRSVMGPADPNAPPLMPAYAVSRTRLLLEAEPCGDGAQFWWGWDAHTGGDWGQVLEYHRKNRKRPRDVIGVAPATLQRVADDVRTRWLRYVRNGYRDVGQPQIAAAVPGLVTTGRTDYERFTFGIGGSGAPKPGVQTTGLRQKRPGQGWTAYGGPNGPGGRGGPQPPPAAAPKPVPPPPKPRKPKPTPKPKHAYSRKEYEALRAQLASAALRPAEKRLLAARWLRARMARPAPVQEHGMAQAESLHRLRFDGVDWHFPTPPDPALGDTIDLFSHPMVQTLRSLAEKPELPPTLAAPTRTVVLSKQRNKDDAHWAQRYGIPNFVSNATGGDGQVVVYNRGSAEPGTLAHEMGHNFARDRWGSTSAPASSDFAQAVASAEPPPTPYAAKSPSEDFAESARLYYEDPGRLKRDAPLRFAALDGLLKGPTSGGP
jgi:hypothetical protein